MIFSPEEIISQNHACTLQTILSIERFIFQNSGLYSKTELWSSLPKKIMYQSYRLVLLYLENQGKITIQNRKVVWISSSSGLNLEDFTAQNHACTINTLVAVEKFVSENSGVYSKTELWNSLPKKMMYQSYKVVMAYLADAGLLAVESRKVVYTGEVMQNE